MGYLDIKIIKKLTVLFCIICKYQSLTEFTNKWILKVAIDDLKVRSVHWNVKNTEIIRNETTQSTEELIHEVHKITNFSEWKAKKCHFVHFEEHVLFIFDIFFIKFWISAFLLMLQFTKGVPFLCLISLKEKPYFFQFFGKPVDWPENV